MNNIEQQSGNSPRHGSVWENPLTGKRLYFSAS
jgi:hypothetical protein